jgi:hypothetical protein
MPEDLQLVISCGLSGEGGPTSSYATAAITCRVMQSPQQPKVLSHILYCLGKMLHKQLNDARGWGWWRFFSGVIRALKKDVQCVMHTLFIVERCNKNTMIYLTVEPCQEFELSYFDHEIKKRGNFLNFEVEFISVI